MTFAFPFLKDDFDIWDLKTSMLPSHTGAVRTPSDVRFLQVSYY